LLGLLTSNKNSEAWRTAAKFSNTMCASVHYYTLIKANRVFSGYGIC
jgi:hypothetical protein